jgi:hypothetical protein
MKYITNSYQCDGFGSQYLGILLSMLYAFNNNCEFVYNPICQIEHNYDNDPAYIEKIEQLINIKPNYKNYDKNSPNKDVDIFGPAITYPTFFNNVDYNLNSECIKHIKKLFWQNKNKDTYFNNNSFNVSIHIRRHNKHDNRIHGTDTPNSYYINVINHIIKNNIDKTLIFHIYSQDDINNFKEFSNIDNIKCNFHLDQDITNTFIGLVAADILVMSQSAFSYVAALLTDGIVYYLPFDSKPSSKWIII